MLLQLLSSLLKILEVRARWALTQEIERYCDDVENRIAEARARGDDALADRLRARFARAAAILPPDGRPTA
jgi:hypothetical protein